jgi:hypothetical protein
MVEDMSLALAVTSGGLATIRPSATEFRLDRFAVMLGGDISKMQLNEQKASAAGFGDVPPL